MVVAVVDVVAVLVGAVSEVVSEVVDEEGGGPPVKSSLRGLLDILSPVGEVDCYEVVVWGYLPKDSLPERNRSSE